jgi:hypothetical protein
LQKYQLFFLFTNRALQNAIRRVKCLVSNSCFFLAPPAIALRQLETGLRQTVFASLPFLWMGCGKDLLLGGEDKRAPMRIRAMHIAGGAQKIRD